MVVENNQIKRDDVVFRKVLKGADIKMIKSKAWEWEIIDGDKENPWKEPSIESYYLINRWLKQGKTDFLDLGCGLGRHTIQFARAEFNTFAFDLSEKSIHSSKEWSDKEDLKIDFRVGDMLNLPYKSDSMDCILCRNVISHTDTEGMKKVVNEIFRVLRKDGECYLTLGSKETWGFKQDWPVVDENTKIRIEDGPENGIPHFYADTDLIFKLFSDFKIINVDHIQSIISENDAFKNSWHYHLLIRK